MYQYSTRPRSSHTSPSNAKITENNSWQFSLLLCFPIPSLQLQLIAFLYLLQERVPAGVPVHAAWAERRCGLLKRDTTPRGVLKIVPRGKFSAWNLALGVNGV